MAKKAERDELTGLLSREGVQKALENRVKNSKSAKGGFSVVLLDIDHFTKLNETFGRSIGDQALVALAEILKKNIRSQDSAGRFAGEEFLLILSDSEKEEALIAFEDVRRLISAKKFLFKDENKKAVEVTFTVSAGIATYPKDGSDGMTLLRNADSALYMAKKFGRDRVVLAVEEKMVLKSNYYTRAQLERLSKVAKKVDVTESFLLREALDKIIGQYEGPGEA